MRRFVALFILALPLFAQRYDDAITVNVVEVPVYVERFGSPITGLTREDFELFVNGAPHPIDYFDVLVGRASARLPDERRTEVRPTLKRRRLVVLLFDIGASSAYTLQRARAKAMKAIAEEQTENTYAVATIGRNGVRFLVPFTNDRIAVQRAIGTLAPSGADDPFRVATLAAERSVWNEVLGGAEAGGGRFTDIWGRAARGGFADSRSAATASESYRAAIDWEEREAQLSDRRFTSDLVNLADRLAPLEGVKHVVLLSTRQGAADLDTFSAMQLHERYREAGVILDGVDIRPPFAPGASADNTVMAGGMNLLPSKFLYALALDTGGAVTSSFEHLQKRNSVAYVIGFRPRVATPRKNNTIRVRLKDRPLLTDVRYRKSFTIGEEDPKDSTLFLADTILNDIPQRGVTVDLRWEKNWVAATIPGEELLAHSPGQPLTLDVFFYVFDEHGQATAWNQMRIALDLVKGRDFLSANPYTIRQEFHLDPGRYTAKALIRIAGTEMTGFRRIDFAVP